MKRFCLAGCLMYLLITTGMLHAQKLDELLFPPFSTFFSSGSWKPNPVVTEHLETYVLSNLRQFKDTSYTVYISGYTDAIGSDEKNMELSRLRAETMASMLIAAGIPSSHINVKYHGESKQIIPPHTKASTPEEIRYANRRVVIRVVKSKPSTP